MSSRSRSRRSTGQPPAKRRRTMEIGEPGTDDDIPTPQAQANAPSASALSVRVLPPEHLPTLATLCIRAFVHNLKQLSRDQNTWEDMQLWLKELPAMLTERVTTGLRNVNPTLLSHGFITTVSVQLLLVSSIMSHSSPSATVPSTWECRCTQRRASCGRQANDIGYRRHAHEKHCERVGAHWILEDYRSHLRFCRIQTSVPEEVESTVGTSFLTDFHRSADQYLT